MKTFIIFIFAMPVILSATVFNNSISGYVTDRADGEPLENVNVYISNTTFGAATDRDGYFIINSIPPGNHELIVSMIGYDFISKQITLKENSDLNLTFKLKQHIFETSSMEVLGEIPDEWLHDLHKFKKYFLGQNQFADECEIENEEILEFKWTDETTLQASTRSPLVIRNNALGYQIRCILTSFTLNTQYEKWSWVVKPEFKELESKDPDINENWSENRKKVFAGSLNHFFLSLGKKNLRENSFVAYFVESPGSRSARRESIRMSEPYENLFYYEKTPEQYILNFDDCLCIVHNFTEVSWLTLKLEEVVIDQYGYPQTANSYIVYGDWASRGIADALPFYFVPEIE